MFAARSIVMGLLALTFSNAACGDPTGPPESGLHAGIIAWPEMSEGLIELPGSARVGEEVILVVGTLRRAVRPRDDISEARVSYVGSVVVVRPYDGFTLPDFPVIMEWETHLHEVALTFGQAGRYQIDIRGASLPGYRPTARTVWIDVTD